MADAVADGSRFVQGLANPFLSPGLRPPFHRNPNSRLGRNASPVAQEGVKMDAIYVGIDVSKDRLDVHVRPSGENFVVVRDGKGLSQLVDRLRGVAPRLIAVEATGGFETIVAAAIPGGQEDKRCPRSPPMTFRPSHLA